MHTCPIPGWHAVVSPNGCSVPYPHPPPPLIIMGTSAGVLVLWVAFWEGVPLQTNTATRNYSLVEYHRTNMQCPPPCRPSPWLSWEGCIKESKSGAGSVATPPLPVTEMRSGTKLTRYIRRPYTRHRGTRMQPAPMPLVRRHHGPTTPTAVTWVQDGPPNHSTPSVTRHTTENAHKPGRFFQLDKLKPSSSQLIV